MLNIDVRRQPAKGCWYVRCLLGMLNIDVRRQYFKTITDDSKFARYVEYRC